jgi:hypothetical protein
MVPDLNYEYHTITIDSNGQAAANTFTSYLEIPLKNVVEAKLLAAHVHTKTSNQHTYISIDELDSNFNDRATPVLNGAGTIGKIKGVFASLTSDVTAVPAVSTTTFVVTVAYIDGGNRYLIDGVDRPALSLQRGNTYVFDLSDGSNSNHPLAFSPTSGSGSFTNGVTDNYGYDSGSGTYATPAYAPGNAGSQVTFTVPEDAPSSIYYYCVVHGWGMGSSTASTISETVGTDHITNFKGDYDVSTQYINPLRKVDKFTVNIMNQDGDGILPNAAGTPNYLIVKFMCLKGNL